MAETSTGIIATALMVWALIAASVPQAGLAEDANGRDAKGPALAVHAAPKFRPNLLRHSAPRLPAVIGGPDAAPRNAIGVPVTPPGSTRISKPSALGYPSDGQHGPSTIETSVARPSMPHPGVWVVPPAVPATLGAINGTTLIRRSSAPLPLGGPAKSTVGINGSTFRVKP